MPAAAAPPVLSRSGERISVEASTYRLEIDCAPASFARSPFASLADSSGRQWMRLALLATVDTMGGTDETYDFAAVEVTERIDDIVISIRQHSSVWRAKEVTLVCTAAAIELSVSVSGDGAITDLVLLGGHAILDGGATGVFRSGIGFASVFVPGPTEPVQFVRPADSAASLGVVGDADPGRLNGIFSPPPFVFGFGRAEPEAPAALPPGEWLGAGLRGDVREMGFTAFRYEPLDGGFLFRLTYEGHTAASGSWTSPTLVLRTAPSAENVLDAYRNDLVAHGFASASADQTARPGWWSEPLFCGWGAQCARLALDAARDGRPVTDLATSLARQDVYDEFLARLDANDLNPGTIVIDDRWQSEYGTGRVDREHWPDLRGWIADRHAEGRRVLLWWKAWDPQGVPPEECILDPAGRPVSVDPSNPAYLARLAATVGALVGTAGLDADGFKVDFTQRAPSGVSLRRSAGGRTDGAWGVAALHALLATIHVAAKAAKADALVVTHAIHPSFGDVSDMVRLNDVLERDVHGEPVPVVDQLRMRALIASHTLPDHLVDTDQWPMPDRAQWRDYVDAQAGLGVPALYYVEYIDNSGEELTADDLARVARSWKSYREAAVRADR